MSSKTRSHRAGEVEAEFWFSDDRGPYEPSRVRYRDPGVTMTDEVKSESHLWPPPKKWLPQTVLGGPFLSVQRRFHASYASVDITSFEIAGQRFHFKGTVAPHSPVASNFPLPVLATANEVRRFGTQAINRTTPTQPLADVGTFLAEGLKDGLPPGLNPRDVPQFLDELKNRAADFRGIARTGGENYLRAEFGWLPFLREINDIIEATGKSSARLHNFYRNSGRRVRRRMTLDGSSDTEKTVIAYGTHGWPTGNGYTHGLGGLYELVYSYETKRWFSGAYTYYAPGSSPGLQNMLQRALTNARVVYGVDISPGVLWNAAPWSWLADYWGNVGDILENMSSFSRDNLSLDYGYLMVQTQATNEFSIRNARTAQGGSYNTSCKYVTTVKQRFGANPYGFGISMDDLSSNQKAILAALAASRL